tara:strand:- start:6313 stop:7398 length:1086 start_codon:yes stop_codon:yes gene_type:complete
MGNKLEAVQLLRGIAALIVVLAHSIRELERQFIRGDIEFTTLDSVASFGASGVDIFFVISGFIMMLVTEKYREMHFDSNKVFLFVKKRFLRVAPLYWFFTILLTLLLFAKAELSSYLPGFGVNNEFSILYFIKSMFFIPSYNSEGKIFPVLGPGWTLNYEIVFYIVFSFFMFTERVKAIIYLLIVFLAFSSFRLIYDYDDAVYIFYTNTIFLEFVFGCLAFCFYRQRIGHKIPRFVWLIIAISSLLLMFFNAKFDSGNMDLYRVLYWGVPSVFLFYSVVQLFADKNISFFWVYLGDISYSLYLSHLVIAVPVLVKLYSFLGLLSRVHYFILLLTTIALSVLAAHLVYKYLEVPLVERSKQK